MAIQWFNRASCAFMYEWCGVQMNVSHKECNIFCWNKKKMLLGHFPMVLRWMRFYVVTFFYNNNCTRVNDQVKRDMCRTKHFLYIRLSPFHCAWFALGNWLFTMSIGHDSPVDITRITSGRYRVYLRPNKEALIVFKACRILLKAVPRQTIPPHTKRRKAHWPSALRVRTTNHCLVSVGYNVWPVWCHGLVSFGIAHVL